MTAVAALSPPAGTSATCRGLGVSRATLHRRRTPLPVRLPRLPRPRPARALTPAEETEVLAALHAERFVDRAPASIVATLLDEGTFLCSVRTMYRLLARRGSAPENSRSTRTGAPR